MENVELFSFNLGFLAMTKGPITKEDRIIGYLVGSWPFLSQFLLECSSSSRKYVLRASGEAVRVA